MKYQSSPRRAQIWWNENKCHHFITKCHFLFPKNSWCEAKFPCFFGYLLWEPQLSNIFIPCWQNAHLNLALFHHICSFNAVIQTVWQSHKPKITVCNDICNLETLRIESLKLAGDSFCKYQERTECVCGYITFFTLNCTNLSHCPVCKARHTS